MEENGWEEESWEKDGWEEEGLEKATPACSCDVIHAAYSRDSLAIQQRARASCSAARRAGPARPRNRRPGERMREGVFLVEAPAGREDSLVKRRYWSEPKSIPG